MMFIKDYRNYYLSQGGYVHAHVRLFVGWLVELLVDRSDDWLVGQSAVGRLVGWLVGPSVGWLFGWVVGSNIEMLNFW